tara:strand:- start:471 stop:794 length:324 start_codon:yes stop_codon:yes gene_type:complete
MSLEPCTREEFEEGLREDGIDQPKPEPTGPEIYRQVEARMTALINTSASDCAITMDNSATYHPVETIGEVTQLLVMMNHKGIERKSHRQAMLRAARKALNSIGEFQG